MEKKIKFGCVAWGLPGGGYFGPQIAKDGKVDIQTSLDAPVVSVVAGRNDTVEDEEEATAEETAEA